MANTRVLFVDDEPNILQAVRRTITGSFELVIALGGEEGMRKLEEGPPFAVVVSDLRMPVIDGVTLLRHVRETSPDTIRMLLTGHADVNNAIQAVNEGQVFRFLTKPCPGSVMRTSLQAALDQHRLVTSERVLLEQTLRGSIRALAEMVSLVHPAVAAHTSRVRRLVVEIGTRMEVPDLWRIEVATLLARLGYVTLPATTVGKLHKGAELDLTERAAVQRVPEVAAQLLANIPRMEEVQSILMYQNAGYDGEGSPVAQIKGERIPIGARLLKLVSDFDTLESRGLTELDVIAILSGQRHLYDPEALRCLGEIKTGAGVTGVVRQVAMTDLAIGMVFAQDVHDEKGVLLIARGQEVTPGLLRRITDYPNPDLQTKRILVSAPAQGPEMRRAA